MEENVNQILSSDSNPDTNLKNEKNKKSLLVKKFFKIQFVFFSILTIVCTGYYIYYQYDKYQNEKLSQNLSDDFNITKLYAPSSSDIFAQRLSSKVYQKGNTSFTIVGLIEIPKIEINYPIISNFDKDLLKIAPCKFYGPEANTVGNLCIAGHNYNSYKFFSRLKDLAIGDSIFIYDLKGQKIEYSVMKSYETDYDDLSCMNQNTNGKKEITLITCNNIKNRRRIIKATEKG